MSDLVVSMLCANVFCFFFTHHDKPGDECCVPDIPETVGSDVRLHLQVEEEALVDDVGNPAKTSTCLISFESLNPTFLDNNILKLISIKEC